MAAELARLRREVRRLEALTRTDALTGCSNYAHILTLLEDEMERTRRTGLPTGLVMLDLDRFKQINDTRGHEAGNEALRWVGTRLRRALRRIDAVGRYGGEEFVAVLPGTGGEETLTTAERLRRTLAEGMPDAPGGPLRITASFGVDAYRGPAEDGPDLTAAAFIARADRFLLQAKREGRNRVRGDLPRLIGAATGVTRDERRTLFSRRRAGRREPL